MAQNIGLTLANLFSQLSEVIAALVSMRSSAVQIALGSFVGSLGSKGRLRVVSDRALAKARDHLSWTGLQRLNSFVVNLADTIGPAPCAYPPIQGAR